jgi:DNA-directed RNA polymerase specialized sigma24 family protein
VLEMHYLDGLPLTECAKRMGRREVYSLKEEAMEEMRKRLKTA